MELSGARVSPPLDDPVMARGAPAQCAATDRPDLETLAKRLSTRVGYQAPMLKYCSHSCLLSASLISLILSTRARGRARRDGLHLSRRGDPCRRAGLARLTLVIAVLFFREHRLALPPAQVAADALGTAPHHMRTLTRNAPSTSIATRLASLVKKTVNFDDRTATTSLRRRDRHARFADRLVLQWPQRALGGEAQSPGTFQSIGLETPSRDRRSVGGNPDGLR